MNAYVQTAVERWFQGWSYLIAPARDGGLLNYLFQTVPSTQSGRSTLLQLANSTRTTFWSDLFIPLLLRPVQSVSVYQIINPSPTSLQAIQSHPRHVFDMLLLAGMLFLCAFVISVSTVGLACCCWWEHCTCIRVKRKSKLTVDRLQQLNQQPKFSVGSVREALHNTNVRTTIHPAQLRRDSESTTSQDLYINCQKFKHGHPADSPAVVRSSPITIQARSNLETRRPLTNLGRERKQYLRRKSHIENPEKCCHYALLFSNIFLLLLLIPCLTLAFYTMDSLFQVTNPSASGTQSPATIRVAVMTLMREMVTFMQDAVFQGEREMNRTVGILQNISKMNAYVQTAVERWFQGWSYLIAPARDGGLLNYLFQTVPSTQSGRSTLLQLANSTRTTFWSDLFIPLLLRPVQSVSVYQIINPSPTSLQAIQSHPRHVFDMLLLAGMLFLCAFVISVSTVGLACCCWWEHCTCIRVKRKSKLTVDRLQQLNQQPKFSVGSVREALHNTNVRTTIHPAQLRRDSESTTSQDLYINVSPLITIDSS
ncbi:hypothetical protein AHF37_12020 [Paragonimus kellicotti]|nr:hypothetical protein AHF37_12020 [Paragonimus kellicotti]